MARSLNDVHLIRGAGIVIVGSRAIAIIGGEHPISPRDFADLLDLVEADDPLAALPASADRSGPAVAIWVDSDDGASIAIPRGDPPRGSGRWVEVDGRDVWRPTADSPYTVGSGDSSESRSEPIPVEAGVWAAAGIAVGSVGSVGSVQSPSTPWWATLDEDSPEVERIDLDAPVPSTRHPLPVEDDSTDAGQPPAEASADLPVVQGILCPRGHVVNPTGRFCHVDGLSLENVSRLLTEGPRHPFAALLVDGRQHVLTRDAVVGRAPEIDTRVVDGRALAIPVLDADLGMSRAHLLLEIRDWSLQAVDLDSALGTFLLTPDAGSWTRMNAGERHELPDGTRIRIGDTEMRIARSDTR